MNTNTPGGSDFEPTEDDQVIGGRRFAFHIYPDWVALAVDPATGKRLSPQARSMYSTLAMHVNAKREDGVVWPGTEALAELAGLARADKVKAHIDPLVRIGAVDVRVYRWGKRLEKSRNLYVVHETPPPGYEGITSLAQFYAQRAALREELVQGGVLSEPQGSKRGAPKIGGSGVSRKNARPNLGTPKRGGPEALEKGVPAPPKKGLQPQEPFELQEREEEAARARAREESPTPTTGPDPGAVEGQDAGVEDEELPEPSLFALISIRQIVEEAPQTTGEGSGRREVIGENEVYELARAFDSESQRLSECGVAGAGGELSAWLSRGLDTAESLYAVLRHRLRAEHASERLTRRSNKAAPSTAQGPPKAVDEVAVCTVHEDATEAGCASCEREHERDRARRAESARMTREHAARMRAELAKKKAEREDGSLRHA